ncbi:MAG TPA: GxxExxY protein [Tepidisphaeraceae bacterium]|jgi:GxxExxY protein
MSYGESTSSEIERVATQVVDAAFRVHSSFGPGLLESVYEACLAAELAKRGFKVLRQLRVPIRYENMELDEGFRIDLLIDDCVIIEVKAVEKMNAIYSQQLKTYLKLTNLQLGLLINFNVSLIKDGIQRVINSHSM